MPPPALSSAVPGAGATSVSSPTRSPAPVAASDRSSAASVVSLPARNLPARLFASARPDKRGPSPSAGGDFWFTLVADVDPEAGGRGRWQAAKTRRDRVRCQPSLQAKRRVSGFEFPQSTLCGHLAW